MAPSTRAKNPSRARARSASKKPRPVQAPKGVLQPSLRPQSPDALPPAEAARWQQLREEEEKLRAYLNKLDADLVRYQAFQARLEDIQAAVQETARGYGVYPVSVYFAPHETGANDLTTQIERHIQDLQGLRNYVRARLNMLVKEEDLLKGLRQRYGKKTKLRTRGLNEFEVHYQDEHTQRIYQELQKGAKALKEIRRKIDSFTL